MKRFTFVFACACLVLAAGCKYRGAVYSEYNQVALDIRASQASSAPIKVSFGYDRGVFAYIPKRNGANNSTQGEAVSVISWNNLSSDANPTRSATNKLLQVDAGFISGIAANVAAAPSNAQVVIASSTMSTNFTITAKGSAGDRIAAALEPSVLRPRSEANQQRTVDLTAKARLLTEDQAKKVLEAAGFQILPGMNAVQSLRTVISRAVTPEEIGNLENAFRMLPN